MKKINTARFGVVEVEEAHLVHFDDGLPAFEDEHEFAILPLEGEAPYAFLQSTVTPTLAFLITTPFVFFPDYEFELDDDIEAALSVQGPEDMELYVLLTIPDGKIDAMTANLMAPVVVHVKTRKAQQVVLAKSRYTTKHPLFSKKEGQ